MAAVGVENLGVLVSLVVVDQVVSSGFGGGSMKRVFFDESGNTGQNLLDAVDPVFVLSSCRFEAAEEEALLQRFAGRQGPEVKFSRLRKREAGRRMILDFVEAGEVNASTVAAYVVNKPFMVVTKYCDIVIEPTFKSIGMDFYARGLNIATANLLAMVMPVYLNARTWQDFLAAFVRVIRERTQAAFSDFQRLAALIHSHLDSAQPDLASHVGAALLLNPDELLPMVSETELDPLVPSYHLLADHWGKRLVERFEMVVDRSKVLAKEQALLMKFSSADVSPFRAGYDRRTVEFPLKVAAISAVDSRSEKQVQLADIIGGALAKAANSSAVSVEGSFENRIFKAFSEKGLIMGGCWPTREIDPVQMGTDEPPGAGQVGLAAYAAMVARDDPRTKRNSQGS